MNIPEQTPLQQRRRFVLTTRILEVIQDAYGRPWSVGSDEFEEAESALRAALCLLGDALRPRIFFTSSEDQEGQPSA